MALTKVKSGNILLTTPSASSNDTTPATTAYVTTALANLVDSAPGTLNTLNELAAALGDDANFSTTVTNSIATKLPLAGGTLTGNLVLSSGGTIQQTVASSGGVYHTITHTGNEQWSWAAQSGSGSDDYLDVGIAGGTRAMSWHEDGKVGIGTTTPEYILQVNGSNVSSGGGLATVGIYDNGTAYNGTQPGGGITFRGKYNSSNAITNFGTIQAFKENGADGDYGSSLILTTRANGGNLTEKFRIVSNGNVGIGTGANADEILHVEKSSGTTLVKTEVASNSTVGFEIVKTGSTTQSWRIVDGQTINGHFEIHDVTDGATRLAIDSDGRVGIGLAANMDRDLHIKGSGSDVGIQIEKTGAGELRVAYDSIGPYLYAENTSHPFRIYVGGGEYLRLHNSGRLSIGSSTTTASANNITLTNGSAAEIDFNCTSGRNFRFQSTSTSGGEFSIVDKNASNATRLLIDSSGRVDLNTSRFRSTSRTTEHQFFTTFANGVSHQFVDLILENTFWGVIDVYITGTYSNQNMVGMLHKRIAVGLNNNNSQYANEGRVVSSEGATHDNFHIGNAEWDSTLSKYKIKIAHLNANGNEAIIKVRAYAGDATMHAKAANFTMGSVYTDATIAYPNPQFKHVGFMASLSSGQAITSTQTKIAFNSESFDQGGCHNNGVFTAPEPGIYQFGVNYLVYPHTSGVLNCRWDKNGSQYSNVVQQGPAGASHTAVNSSIAAYLSTNDTFQTSISGSTNSGANVYGSQAYWYGYKVG